MDLQKCISRVKKTHDNFIHIAHISTTLLVGTINFPLEKKFNLQFYKVSKKYYLCSGLNEKIASYTVISTDGLLL